MGKIVRQRIVFGGGGDSDPGVWISKADYNALSEAEKNSDTEYYVYDDDSTGNAYAVPFTSDQYEADSVGDALNEVKGDVDAVNESLGDIKYVVLESDAEYASKPWEAFESVADQIPKNNRCVGKLKCGGSVWYIEGLLDNDGYGSFLIQQGFEKKFYRVYSNPSVGWTYESYVLNSDLDTQAYQFDTSAYVTPTFYRSGKVKRVKVYEKPSADLLSSTSYKLGTITDGNYLPIRALNKEICIGYNLFANLTITTSGEVSIYPRQNISANDTLYIDEMYI